LCKSFVAERWEKESIEPAKLRTLKIKIYLNPQQKKQINEFIDTSRYVYNKTLEQLKKGHTNNFFNLRDLLVTNESKKGNVFVMEYDSRIKEVQEKLKNANELEIEIFKNELRILKKEKLEKMKSVTAVKNPLIKEFELRTPKEIRANAVKQCCDAMKAGISNLKNGNIKFFNMKFRKKSSKQQGIEVAPSGISFQDGQIKLLPKTFGKDCFIKVHNRMKKKIIRNKIQIDHNVDIIRNNNKEYFLYLVIPTVIKEKKKESGIPIPEHVSGIDLGVRTFATVFSNNLTSNETKVIEYNHRIELLKKLNSKIDFLKSRKRIRRNQISKYEKRKKNLIDSIHWDFIKDIINESDIIFLGHIKSHNIVKGGKNKNLNRDLNDLKFYLLKERLVYKASVCHKKVVLVKEHFTTKTCSNCGWLNKDIGSSKVFNCLECKLEADRDSNAAKNILLKGLLN
jgi:putative transposase